MSEGRMLPPKEKRTAAYKIFHYPFMWKFADNETFDVNDTEFFGRLSSGNAEFDAALATAKSDRYMTTDKVAEIADRGVSVILADPIDSIDIYNMISEHLNDWRVHLRRPGAFGKFKDVPLKDLKALNGLARGLALVGRRHGLVEDNDPYEKNRARRAHSIGYRAPINYSEITHSDETYNEIATLVKKGRIGKV